MKKFISATAAVFLCYSTIAQLVGIGITSPGAGLDVAKPGGDVPTANFRGSLNISHFNFGANEDTYIRGGKAGSHVILNDLGSGKVGIGTSAPGFPLNFSNSIGDKISLYGNSGPHYGFGIQGYLLQIHTDASAADIAFGYGSSASFNETMRMKGNGIMQFPASLAKKIILYPGSIGDAGFSVFANELRIASDYSGADISFGFDDRSAGFTERFRMKANGALVLNGSAGLPGQVLASAGGAANTWVNQKTPSFNTFKQNDWQLTIRRDNSSPGEPLSWHVIGGMHNQTITINNTSTVMMEVRVPLYNPGNTFGGVGVTQLYLGLYDASNNYIEFDVAVLDVENGTTGQAIAFGSKPNIAPGTYRTHVKILRYYDEEMAMGAYYTGADHGSLVVQVIPQ